MSDPNGHATKDEKKKDEPAVDKNGKVIVRKLTADERKQFNKIVSYLAKYGRTIDLNNITLQQYKSIVGADGKSNAQFQVTGKQPNVIKVGKGLWSEDYAKMKNKGNYYKLTHELGHVYAFSNDPKKKPSPDGKLPYLTPFVSGRKFDDYGTEQQGEIFRGLAKSLDGAKPGSQMGAGLLNNKTFTPEQYDEVFMPDSLY
jgi:hypothetical protein